MWLKELTSNAIVSAQRAREQQLRAAQAQQARPSGRAATNGSASAAQNGHAPRGDMPIEQILEYIQKDDAPRARKNKKKNAKGKHH